MSNRTLPMPENVNATAWLDALPAIEASIAALEKAGVSVAIDVDDAFYGYVRGIVGGLPIRVGLNYLADLATVESFCRRLPQLVGFAETYADKGEVIFFCNMDSALRRIVGESKGRTLSALNVSLMLEHRGVRITS